MSKKIFVAGLAIVFVLPGFAPANGLNLNGLGSRAVAMGGAFVGVADDFSAVFWNPAGAAGFRKEIFGFYATDLMPKATYRLHSPIPEVPIIDAKTQTSHYLGGLASYTRPIGPRVVIGLGIGTPSGLGTMWDGEDFVSLSNGTVTSWSSKIGLFSFSPLIAIRLGSAVSVGATLNVNYGVFNLKMPAGSAILDDPPGTPVDLGQYEEAMTGWGMGATFGVLVTPSEKIGIGLTVRTPTTVSFQGTASMSNMSVYGRPGSSELKRKISWPLWIAGGVSFRPVQRLLLSADVHWTRWSKLDRITTDYLDSVWAEIMGAEGKDVRLLDWSDKTQFRFGAEYIVTPSTTLRAGYSYDPAPAPDATLNVLLPSHTFNVLSIGIGQAINDLQLDFGLEYLMGNTRTADLASDEAMPGTYGMTIIAPSISVSYKF